jgi:hypothetical protein
MPSMKNLSYKEKEAVKYAREMDEMGFFPAALKMIYASDYNIKNCLKRLCMLGFLKRLESGKFIYVGEVDIDMNTQLRLLEIKA